MDNLPVIFRLSIGKTKGRIHIPLTNNMRYAQMVTFNNHVIFFVELEIFCSVKFFSAAA